MPTQPLTFVPLGGSFEIGMNLNVYGHAGRWLIVDCGIGFERISITRTEVFLPDPSFLAHQPECIAGMVITHVHLDHLGAVADLWPQLRCPIHCTPFAATVLRPKLREVGLHERVPIHEHLPGSRFEVGPFDVEMVGLTHSTLEMQGLALRTPSTTVFHTGDFKLDPDPGTGPCSDLDRIRALGDEGVDVVVSDSTNATKPGHSRSEAEVHAHLDALVAKAEGRVFVGTFSSNVARIEALIRIADRHDRHPVLLGRSLQRMVRAAQASGYLRDLPPLVDPREAGYLPRRRVLYLCTGTQAEPGAALTRLAWDRHRQAVLDPGDTVIFSSKIIPGNEDVIEGLHTVLEGQGVHVVHEGDDPAVHASGHPARDELAALYEALRPGVVVPVHGTPRHMDAHADWAEQLGHGAHQVRNGDVLHLGPGEVRMVGEVHHDRIPRDAFRELHRPDGAPPVPRRGRSKPWGRRRR